MRSRSDLVSTCLGVNWARGATKVMAAGIAVPGTASSRMRASAPQREISRRVGRQEEGHVNVGQIEQRRRLAAGRQHLARFGQAVEHARLARRLQHAVGDQIGPAGRHRRPRRLWPRRRWRGGSWRHPARRRRCGGCCGPDRPRCSATWPLPNRISARSISLAAKSASLARWSTSATDSLARAAGLAQLRLGGAELRFQVAGVERGDHGAGLHQIAFLDRDGQDAGGVFGGDVDLVRLDPAIAGGEAGGQPVALHRPPAIGGPRRRAAPAGPPRSERA